MDSIMPYKLAELLLFYYWKIYHTDTELTITFKETSVVKVNCAI